MVQLTVQLKTSRNSLVSLLYQLVSPADQASIGQLWSNKKGEYSLVSLLYQLVSPADQAPIGQL